MYMLCAGELVCKKASEPLDGAPFVAGTVTLLKQFHSENAERFFALLGQYVRSMIASTNGFVRAVCCLRLHIMVKTSIKILYLFQQRHHLYTLCSVTAELFRLPPLKSGTLYRNTSSQLPRCSPSGVTWKRFIATIFLPMAR